MSPVAAPADRRFRRAHVKPTRKRGPWRVLVGPLIKYGLITLAAVYAVYRGAAVIAHARALRIDHIVVRGNQRLSSGEVLAVLNGLRGENIVRADLTAWRRRLLSSPWVRDAALRRSLPSTVEVMVSERAPIGIGRIKGELYLVDDRGVVIDEYGPQYADVDLPIIDGLNVSPDARTAADGSRAELASRVVAALWPQPSVARRLSQIDVTDLHNAAVILSGDPAVIYVGEDRFLQRLQSYIDLSASLRLQVHDIDSVDLRFDDRIYVRPVGKPGKSGTARVAIR
ncbi:MAG TPA: FtsQ-type POTRA domain-containing protein [Solirubrobacteraceae bacterium]|nr:FtsQ-type POTRA domain-containing protein [Solirubrobacteraceae bacterium]